jgi:hypothetical protein
MVTLDQESRIRAALGLDAGPLPEVGKKWFDRYFEYLAPRLLLPFDAEYADDSSGYQQLILPVKVLALLHPDQCDLQEDDGLLCVALRGKHEIEIPLIDVELPANSPNSQLIEDYWYWFWNWRFDPKI